VRLTGLACALTALGVASPAAAIDLEKLVMPGPVIGGHAEVEAECSRCHAPFKAGAQDPLCTACHKEIGADVAAHTGFHGRLKQGSGASCKDCHSEHRGRDADIVGLDRAGFEHDLTDYPLRGAHVRVPCEACHAAERPHFEAPSACVECHRERDVHAGLLGEDCAGCHVERSWQEARFDHSVTRFPLEGGHRQVDCVLCHPGNRYKGATSDCLGCHRLNDAHLGRFGARCESCHSAAGWKQLHFDHGRDARFPLRGRHRDADCEACHKGVLGKERLARDCASCHRADDVHRGRNGKACERCHSEKSWSSENFDHDRMTKFPLRGGHANVKCERCHTAPLANQKLPVDCYSCHRGDDVHGGQEGNRCDTCHEERGWAVNVFFEHDLTRFPLLGLHAAAACEQCHASPRYRDAKTGCLDCHRNEDVHLLRLGPKCGLCHNPNGWKIWRFDHDSQTRFALHGAHQGLDCHACHRAAAEDGVSLPRACQGCHAQEDPHHGAFGPDCGRCHGDDSWRNLRMGR
jgi:hypothetical protein